MEKKNVERLSYFSQKSKKLKCQKIDIARNVIYEWPGRNYTVLRNGGEENEHVFDLEHFDDGVTFRCQIV